MEKNLYIDASHPNETRVVLKSGESIEDYEYEGLKNNLIKNNIYLGKVSRVEPSLQAAFIDFGRERHGFLSFNDIQSDYYQIPQSDLAKIKEEEEKAKAEEEKSPSDAIRILKEMTAEIKGVSADKKLDSDVMKAVALLCEALEEYKEKVVEPLDIDRDKSVLTMIDFIFEKKIPLLAICRGFQEVNVALGGSLHADIHDVPGRIDHRAPDSKDPDVQFAKQHEVYLTSNGKMEKLAGTPTIDVNSLHTQGIDSLASNF